MPASPDDSVTVPPTHAGLVLDGATVNVFTVTVAVAVAVEPEPDAVAVTVYSPAIAVVTLLSIGPDNVEL